MPVSTIDIMPTVLAWLGQYAQYLTLQGMNLLPSLQDSLISLPQRYIFSEIPTQLSVISGRLQLLYGKEKKDMSYPRVPAVEELRLIDHTADPLGRRDLSTECSETATALKTAAESYLKIPQPSYTEGQLPPGCRRNKTAIETAWPCVLTYCGRGKQG